ncbi:hypothetical protein Tco_0247425 [Tanacetum coccineum]
MSTLTFADTHNMVAFLEKPTKSDGFHEIIDFLNANQIRYALTVNPTIYTSCIQRFWATAKTNTINGERGTDCFPSATIFEELARIGHPLLLNHHPLDLRNSQGENRGRTLQLLRRESYAFSQVEMDDPNITVEEYIELEDEKARRHDYPTIDYKDALAPDHEILSEPMVSPHHYDGIDFDFKISFDEFDDEDYIFDENREASHDILGKSSALKDFVIMIKVMIQMHYYEGMPLNFMIKNLYMSFGFPFDPKLFYKDGAYTKCCGGRDMAQLPPRDQRHPWLRYKGQEYTDVVIHDYEARLGTIFGRQVNKVHVLDFEGLTDEMRQTLTDRLRMVHTGTEGQVLFTSDAWKRVFGIRGLLVQELILCLFHRFYMRFVSPVGVLVIGESVGSVPERFSPPIF